MLRKAWKADPILMILVIIMFLVLCLDLPFIAIWHNGNDLKGIDDNAIQGQRQVGHGQEEGQVDKIPSCCQRGCCQAAGPCPECKCKAQVDD